MHEVQGMQGRPAMTFEHEALTEQEVRELTPEMSHGEVETEVEQELEKESETEHSTEWLARELLEHIEAHAFGHEGSHKGGMLARFVLRQNLRAVLLYTKAIVRRMARNPQMKRKLMAASRRGPKAVTRLVGIAVLGALPRPFRRASRRLVALSIRACFRHIARHAGLSSAEIDLVEFEKETLAKHFSF
jgi:hypothetical protein